MSTYPVPDPLCPACGKPVRYMSRRKCRQCNNWCHGPCAPRHVGDTKLGGVCIRCRGIDIDENGKWRPTPSIIKDICKNVCKTLGLNSPTEKSVALIILMSAIISGPDEMLIIRDTGLGVDFVSVVAKRLRDAKIWDNDLVDMEWDDPDGGDVIFVLHVLVGTGSLVRTFDPEPSEIIDSGLEKNV